MSQKHKQHNRIIKQTLSLIIVGLVLLSAINLSAVADGDDAIAKTVTVGVMNGLTNRQDGQSDSVSAYVGDYLAEIAKETGWKYSYKSVGLEQGLDMLENGEIDLFGPLQYSKERAEKFDYPDLEFGYEQTAIYALAENSDVFYEDYQAFNRKKVALLKGNHNNTAFDEYCVNNGFEVSKYFYNDVAQMINAVKAQEVDMMVIDSLIESNDVKVIGKFAMEKYYYVTKKENTNLIVPLNQALHKIKTENPYFDVELYNQYYSEKSSSKIGFTRQEYEYIINHPTLSVVGDPDWEPIEFYDTKQRTQAGINVDLLRELSKNCGIQFKFVKTETYQQSIEMILNGKADIISGNTNLISEEFARKTDVYMSSPIALLGRTNTIIKDKYKLAMIKEGAEETNSFFENQSGAQPVYYNSMGECVKAVQNGEADMTLMSVHIFDMFTKKGEYSNLKVIRTADVPFDIRLGVSTKLDPIALSILNKAIKNLSEKQRNDALIENTIGKTYAMTWKKAFAQYYMAIIIGIMLIMLLIFFVASRHKSKLAKILREIAYTDPLTGASSMEKFKNDCSNLFTKFKRNDYSMLYFDVDKFKYINDTFGYHVGNAVLCHISKCIQEVLYQYEIFTRLSGDTFIMMIKNTDEKQIQEIYNKLVRNIQLQADVQRASHKMIICFGIYKFTEEQEDLFTAIDKANIARKTVKGKHESSYAFYDDSMHQQFVNEGEIVGSMRAALAKREFELYLQPKVDLETQKIAGAEALVRWNHPKRGLIPPSDFLPVLERNGFITEIDFFIFEETCKTLRTMIEEGYPVRPISVNLSRVHMKSAKFINRLIDISKRYEISTDLLELELTETMVLENSVELLNIINKIKSLGFILSMDDFGTGYSSLNILKELPFDILKIDRGFFNDEHATKREQTILHDIVRMAHHLNMKVVSEGVETQRQCDLLKSIKCDIAQGYLYAKPMPVEKFLSFVKDRQ